MPLSVRLALLLACLLGGGCAAPSAGYATLPYTSAESRDIRLPFLREYAGNGRAVFVYGGYHTRDPADAELADIERQIARFKPDLVLYEGDNLALAATRTEAIRRYYESGFALRVAYERGIETANLEPPAGALTAHLLARFPREQVLVATVLGQNANYLAGADRSAFEALWPYVVRDLERERFPLAQEEKTLAFFDAAYASLFGRRYDPASFDVRTIDLREDAGPLNPIERASAEFRDRHMLTRIADALKRKKRIYVQVGGRHAVVWQPALEAMLGDK